jgi:hypothetical protein
MNDNNKPPQPIKMKIHSIRLNRNHIGILLITIFCFQSQVFSQDPVQIKRLGSAIEFDGNPNEAAWESLDLFPLTMHRPNFGNQPSEESDVRVGYDNEYLWIGASLFMKDASRIYAATKKRDEMLFDYDAFGIVVDSYNDNESGLAFYTAPTGLRTDFAVANDAAGGPGGMNISWDTFWDVKTTRDDRGWYVEMRIPFSSLKFKPENDVATMGLIITRNISANNETDTYPDIDPKYGFTATMKPSQARKIEIDGARPSNPLYVSPYVIGGYGQEYTPNAEETDYTLGNYPKYNGGLDVKYNINSNLTLDLTANTDFAQVEADDQQVNLTRYSLFFPEKRKFFQERSSLFDFSLGGHVDNLFYSRNIGLVDGQQIRIYGGARLTGRLGKWDMGLLDMQTADHEEIAGENFGVIRMRRQVINPNSYVGGIFTSRVGMDGKQNFTYGVDGIFRLFGDDYLNVKWAQSYDTGIDSKLSSLDPSFVLLNWERRSEEGFAYSLDYSYSGTKFNPGIGFIMRNGVQGGMVRMLYGWIPGEESRFFNYNFNVRANRYVRIEDGGLESMEVSPGFEFSTKKGIHGEISTETAREGVLWDFNLSDSIAIEAGDYTFTALQFRLGTSEARRISVRGDANLGQFYDGMRYGFQSEFNLNFSSSFILSPGYEFNYLTFPDRESNNKLNIHAINVKGQIMISTKLSANFLVQYVNTEDEFIGNFRIRYNPREGNDFYLVYNDNRCFIDRREIAGHPNFHARTLMLKYTHTFVL